MCWAIDPITTTFLHLILYWRTVQNAYLHRFSGRKKDMRKQAITK